MYILKILEGVLQAGASQISFTDTDIPNSAISTFTSKDGLYPTRSVISGSTITLYYQPQSTNTNIALKLVRGNLEIIDALTDTSTNKALSANQGKELKDLIDNIIIPVVPENITDLDDVSVTSIQNGQVLAWNSTSEKFENVNQSGGGENKIFVDTTNVIFSDIFTTDSTNYYYHYTATENCFVEIGAVNNANNSSAMLIDDVAVENTYSSALLQKTYSTFLKAGQKVSSWSTYRGGQLSIIVYGLK